MDHSIRLKKINLHILGKGKKQQVIVRVFSELGRQYIEEFGLAKVNVHFDLYGEKYFDIVYPYEAWDQLIHYFENSEKYIDTSHEVFRKINNNREYRLVLE